MIQILKNLENLNRIFGPFSKNPLILSLKRKNTPFLCQLFSMLYSIEMSITQVEVSAAFPFSFSE